MAGLQLFIASVFLLIASSQAAKQCQADIVLTFDVSKSITQNQWDKHVTIAIEDITARLAVAQDAVRVGLVSFNETAITYPENGAMYLTTAPNRDTVLQHMKSIKYHSGGTCIECGLRANIDNFLEKNGDRPDVPNYGVLISDGHANVRKNYLDDAIKAVHQAGITMFVLAVSGEEVPDRDTLSQIAGKNGRVFYIENPRDAKEALDDITSIICGRATVIPEDPCKLDPCKNSGKCINDKQGGFICKCAPGFTGVHCEQFCNKMDLSFILDSSGSIKRNGWVHKIRPFVKEFITSLNPRQGGIHIASVSFSKTSEVDFLFNDVDQSLDNLFAEIDNLDYLRGKTCIACGLQITTDEIFSVNNGRRPNVPHVAVLFTDGRATVNEEETISEAERLKATGTKLFAVGMTDKVNDTELQTIVTQPFEQYYLKLEDLSQLLDATQMISGMACAQSAPELISSRKRRDVDTEMDDLAQASIAGSRIARHASR